VIGSQLGPDWKPIGPPIGENILLAKLTVTPVVRVNATLQGHLFIDVTQGSTIPVNLAYNYDTGTVNTESGMMSCTNGGASSNGCIVVTSSYDISGGIRVSVGFQLEVKVFHLGAVKATPNAYIEVAAGLSSGGSGFTPYCQGGIEGTQSGGWVGVCGGFAFYLLGGFLGHKVDYQFTLASALLTGTVTIMPTSATLPDHPVTSFGFVVNSFVSSSLRKL
jgi:hypothetical protein